MSTGPHYPIRMLTGWKCDLCPAKDAEIASLKESNATLYDSLMREQNDVASFSTIMREQRAEIAALRNKLDGDSQNFQIECQRAEIAALRERCGRLAAEVNAWRSADSASQVLQPRTNMGFVLNKLHDATAACNAHNDLDATPAAGKENDNA